MANHEKVVFALSNTCLDTPEGNTVRIKVPVVATVIQKSSEEGTVSMSIQSPGLKDDNMMDSHYFYTTMAASSDFPAGTNKVSNLFFDGRLDYIYESRFVQFLFKHQSI